MMMLRYLPVSLLLLVLLTACSNENNVSYTPPAGSSETAITKYVFGIMDIDGQSYRGDLIVKPDGTVSSWLFDNDTHEILPSNLEHLLDNDITTLIIGLGYSSQASLPEETLKFVEQLRAKGVEVFFEATSEAVRRFNATPKKGLLACFHLNC